MSIEVLHGTWIPYAANDFRQEGSFCLWVETNAKGRRQDSHSASLQGKALAECLKSRLGFKEHFSDNLHRRLVERYFVLPTYVVRGVRRPVKSYDLLKYLGETPSEDSSLDSWKIACYPVSNTEIIKTLKDLYFLLELHESDVILGTDLLFWLHYTQSFKEVLLKDQYIPALKYRERPFAMKSKKNHPVPFDIVPAWEILSPNYETLVRKYAKLAPAICVAGAEQPRGSNQAFTAETLLRHFSENVVHSVVVSTLMPNAVAKKFSGTILSELIPSIYTLTSSGTHAATDGNALKLYKNWLFWREKLLAGQVDSAFHFGFQLQEAQSADDDWTLHFLMQSKRDPSLKIMLDEYWAGSENERRRYKKAFGADSEKQVLLSLGQAARMYPKIWEGLETDKPSAVNLDLDEAFEFLKEASWVLEDAGFKVIIPAWWTPKGRRKAKIRIRGAGKSVDGVPAAASSGAFGYESIVQYQYALSIGGEAVSQDEWEELVRAKTPLVQFRGEWMELDRGKMQEMLEFWQKHGDEQPEISLIDLMKVAADEDAYEFDHDDALAEMFAKLRDKSRYEPLNEPPKFNGELREYQKRGLSWLHYLETLGLGGCLADDMGLGKTVQVIAQLLNERASKKSVLPTLLIAPTSVLGNWQKEIERFAPSLVSVIHHGGERSKDAAEFEKNIAQADVVISSYALARRDEKILCSREWERVVLDEAQNIKNPKAAQSKSILKFKAQKRLALTGTPVENRLMDLWSIVNFLNRGYLGTAAGFRKAFEVPVQRDNDLTKAKILKNLVEPLILRRLKTDKAIIKDLPDKVEQKVYCNLTKEQASLYEAVVKDVMEQVEESEGIQRRGVILASLMKLKQICNHPAQFLQDGSEFSRERSHKLSRLLEMIEEAVESGESVLIFSQFKEVCSELDELLRKSMHYSTYLLHGGTSRKKRQQMIDEFQDPATEPSVFILSLKAGGVGITLTKANHVFHFDRWWNPAVENQATDRAFRIGQEKNVFVHKYVATGTLEERIDQLIEDKKKFAEAVVGSDESWLTELDNESIKKLISLSKDAVLE